jgi:hypothetical protein
MPRDGRAMRAAFYALRPGGYRDWVTLLHPPYTIWHLTYVVIGGCLAPGVSWSRLGLGALAFFLAMGIGAHALDELNGRPLGTGIGGRTLVVVAVLSVAAACAIGVFVVVTFSRGLLVFIVVGAFLVPAYNLELFGGRFHTDLWFGLAWGGFPTLTGYFVCAGTIRLEALLAAAAATVLSLAQRRLSTFVRTVRRRVDDVSGEVCYSDGTRRPIERVWLVAAPEAALGLLTWTTVLAAATLVVFRLATTGAP